MSFRVKPLQSYMLKMDIPKSTFQSYKPDEDTVNLMQQAIFRNQQQYQPIEDKRSTLDRVLSPLLAVNYASAGFARGFVNENFNPLQGAWEGIKAGNPFGQGNRKGQHTYSDYLEDIGWKPESWVGKFAKGTTGFVMDVLLDPTTYLSGGATALVKGSGRTTKVAQQLRHMADEVPVQVYENTIAKFQGTGVNPQLAERFAKKKADDVQQSLVNGVTHMTDELAEVIVQNRALSFNKPLTPEQLSRDASNFAREYNRITGIRDINPQAVTFGLENLPFGHKFADKFGVLGKTVTLGDGSTLRSISDKLHISNAYAGLRESIYGSKIGKLFSTTSPLYKLAQENPKGLYEFMKAKEMMGGLTVNKLEAEKLIRDKAKDLGILSPAEQREIINLLEDKTVWARVKANVKFAETERAKEIGKVLQQELADKQQYYDEVLKMKTNAENMRFAQEQGILRNEDVLRNIDVDYQKALADVDLQQINDQKMYESMVNNIKDEVHRMQAMERELRKNNGVEVERLQALFKQAQEESVARKTHYDAKKAGEKVAQQPPTLTKSFELTDELSQYVYGRKDALNPKLSEESLEELITRINRGETPDQIQAFIEDNAHIYSNHMREVNSYLAEKLNYKSYLDEGEEVRWKNVYDKRVDEFIKLNETNQLSPEQYQEWLKLNALKAERTHLKKQYFNRMSYDEFKEFRRQEANAKMMKEFYDEINPRLNTHEQVDYGNTRKRDRFADETSVMAPKHKDVQMNQKVGTKSWGGKTYEIYDVKTKDVSTGKEFTKKRYVDPNTGEAFRLEKGKMIKTEENIRRSTIDNTKNLRTGEFDEKVKLSKDDVLTDQSVARMNQDAIEHYLNSLSKKVSKQKGFNVNMHRMKASIMGENATAYTDKITQTMKEEMLSLFPNRRYEELSSGQKSYLMRESIKRVALEGKGLKELDPKQLEKLQKRAQDKVHMERIQAIHDTVKEGTEVTFRGAERPYRGHVTAIGQTAEGLTEYTVKTLDGHIVKTTPREIHKVMQGTRMMEIDQVIVNTPVMREVMEQRKALEKQLDEAIAKSKEHIGKYDESRQAIHKMYKESVKNTRLRMAQLEDARKRWDNASKAFDQHDVINGLEREMDNLFKAIDNDDALETFVRLDSRWGNKFVDNVTEQHAKANSVLTVLDGVASNETVAKMARYLRQEFMEMGLKETQIRKLDKDAFNEMLERYVPHILTPSGKVHVAKNSSTAQKGSAMSRQFGFGAKFNPYSKSRKSSHTIEEMNNHFRDVLKGKNFFSENIADIYLARALKHNDLMYDNEYMRTMMDVFGKELPSSGVVEKGYKAVVNHGILKERVGDLARIEIDKLKSRGVPITDERWQQARDHVMEKMGLNPRILDDFSVPMVELNGEQAKRVNHFARDSVKQVNDAIVMRANQARQLQIDKDQSRMLQMYDKFLHWTKLMQTTVMPAFHLRNKISNTFLNWLGVGADAINPTMQKNAWLTSYHMGDAKKLSQLEAIVTPSGHVYQWDEVYAMALQNKVINEGFFAKDIGAGSQTQGMLAGKVRPSLDPTNTTDFVGFKKGAEWGGRIENQDRLIHFASALRQGKSVEEASAQATKYLFDYSDLTAFEQNVMKRLIPYYTWLRKNGRLMTGEIVEQPGKFRDSGKVMNAINNSSNQEDRINPAFMHDFAEDWVQLPFRTADGRPVIMNPFMPFMDFNRFPNPWNPSRTAREGFSQLAPQIKVPLELMANHNMYFDNPIVRDGDNPITPRVRHILRQLAPYTVGEGLANKEGVDQRMYAISNMTGVKHMPYNYDASRARVLDELRKNQ